MGSQKVPPLTIKLGASKSPVNTTTTTTTRDQQIPTTNSSSSTTSTIMSSAQGETYTTIPDKDTEKTNNTMLSKGEFYYPWQSHGLPLRLCMIGNYV